MSPGPILLCQFVRTNKNDSLMDQVEMKEANPTYAHVCYMAGRNQLFPFDRCCTHFVAAVDLGCFSNW